MKLRFSKRYGFSSVRQSFQTNSMDDDLRNGLWNALLTTYWTKINRYSEVTLNRDLFYDFIIDIWINFYKKPLDTMPKLWKDILKRIKDNFYDAEWYEVYDLLEFVACNAPYDNKLFKEKCNNILEKEMSAYRFMGNFIGPIVDEAEIEEIDIAIGKNKYTQVSKHLSNALELLSDRHNPDYRNSIKESISAVESIVKLLSNKPKCKFKDGIRELETKLGVRIHKSLSDGFVKIYGYTCDGDGIRHALIEEPNVSFEDAKFFLVACSAFVNYILAKAEKAGLVDCDSR